MADTTVEVHVKWNEMKWNEMKWNITYQHHNWASDQWNILIQFLIIKNHGYENEKEDFHNTEHRLNT